MKKLLFFTILFCSSLVFGQTYQLIGDSCMRCNYQQNIDGGSTLYNIQYIFDPMDMMTINSITYSKFPNDNNGSIEGVRQAGNKLYGLNYADMEYLVMDFDALPGDTIYDLYSNSVFYNARVDSLDSILRTDGTYHHFMSLTGIEHGYPSWDPNSAFNSSEEWRITWNELGLCGINYSQIYGPSCIGGYTFNVPGWFYNISYPDNYGTPCTPDSRYSNILNMVCPSCNFEDNSISEQSQVEFELFPNPTNDKLQLRFSDFDKKSVKISNTSGQTLMHFSTQEEIVELNMEHIAIGVYFVTVSNEKMKSTRLAIKN